MESRRCRRPLYPMCHNSRLVYLLFFITKKNKHCWKFNWSFLLLLNCLLILFLRLVQMRSLCLVWLLSLKNFLFIIQSGKKTPYEVIFLLVWFIEFSEVCKCWVFNVIESILFKKIISKLYIILSSQSPSKSLSFFLNFFCTFWIFKLMKSLKHFKCKTA